MISSSTSRFNAFLDPFTLYTCARFILIQAPQGGVKKDKEGRNNNNLNLIVDITHYYRYTHHIHITHETCLLRQVGLQYYTSQDYLTQYHTRLGYLQYDNYNMDNYNMIITILIITLLIITLYIIHYHHNLYYDD